MSASSPTSIWAGIAPYNTLIYASGSKLCTKGGGRKPPTLRCAPVQFCLSTTVAMFLHSAFSPQVLIKYSV
eukprot:2054381-Pyramimonas_sp.AAC.1